MSEPDRLPDDIVAPIRAAVVKYYMSLAALATGGLLITAPLRDEPAIIILSYVLLLANFSVAYAIRNKRALLAGALASLGPFVLVSLMVWVRGGMSNPAAITAYVTLLVVTGLCWSSSGTLIVGVLSSAVLGWFVIEAPADVGYNKWQQWGELVAQLVIVAGIVRLTLRALTRSAAETLAQEKRFQDAIEGSPDGIIGLDAQGCVQIFNHKAALMSGTSKEEARGRPLRYLAWLDDDALNQLDMVMETVAAGKPMAPIAVGSLKNELLEISVAQVQYHEGEPDRLITVRDVTELRRAAEAQEALEARLAHSKSIDALGRLAGGVAHDYNNLLTIITGTTELLRRKDMPELSRDLDLIEGAADRAAKLTAQLLAFGRKQVLQPTVLSPNSVLRDLEPLIGRLIPSNIQLRFETSRDTANVRVDEARLEQVILNLISNACDAMPEGGVLTVGTRNAVLGPDEVYGKFEAKPGSYVVISVRDTGVGIPEEVLGRLFEPFFTTKDQGKGTGLGLAMVHGIVAQSGGFLSVQSRHGQGAQFYVYLPQCNEVGTVQRDSATNHKTAKGDARVLLVEDEPGVRSSAERMLQVLGYTVETAENGLDAVERYSERIFDFDVIVSDVVMPHLSGPEMVEHFANLRTDLRVLFISGYTEKAIVRDGVLLDGVHYLSKPFRMQALSDKLRELCAPSEGSALPAQAAAAD